MGAKGDQVKGRAKEATGHLTGNKRLAREGKADRLGGEAKEKVHDAGHSIHRATDKVIDRAKSLLHHT